MSWLRHTSRYEILRVLWFHINTLSVITLNKNICRQYKHWTHQGHQTSTSCVSVKDSLITRCILILRVPRATTKLFINKPFIIFYVTFILTLNCNLSPINLRYTTPVRSITGALNFIIIIYFYKLIQLRILMKTNKAHSK